MKIGFQKFGLTIEAIEPLELPYYKGSTFRGGFGNAFKRVVCALKRRECNECLLLQRCVYAYIFETSPPEGTKIMTMHKYETVPHPFIIEPPAGTRQRYNPGDTLSFTLILIGRASEYLPYFIYTFEELGRLGLGKGRGKYRLLRVDHRADVVYSGEERALKATVKEELDIPEEFIFDRNPEGSVTLKFLTPARVMYQRTLTEDLQFHILIRSLLRRLCLLHYFHCEPREPLWDHRGIIEEGEKIAVEKNSLRWWDWERYSSRQGTKMKMGGVIGEITYGGRIEPFLPILRDGEILHVGKGTSFGLGKYELQQVL